MPDYKKSQIYQIWSPSNPDLVYIGSTTQSLAVRMAGHRRQYKCYLNGKQYYVSSFKVLACGDARIELIEAVECKNKAELHAIEGKYIRERDCCNKYIPGRNGKQYRLDNREKRNERQRQYYQDNKEKCIEYHQQYNQKNKQKINERQRQYYQDNKEKCNKQLRQYYEKNKVQLNAKRAAKVECPCGSTVSKSNISAHRKTKKHQAYIQSLQ